MDADTGLHPWSFSPDGRFLAYFVSDLEIGTDIWVLPLNTSDPDHPKADEPPLFLRTPANEMLPRFSPDGRWIVCRSDESGAFKIYMRPFPNGAGGKWNISSGGGLYVVWSNNGHELFYETFDHRIMVLDYKVEGDSLIPGRPRLWSNRQLFYPGANDLGLAPTESDLR